MITTFSVASCSMQEWTSVSDSRRVGERRDERRRKWLNINKNKPVKETNWKHKPTAHTHWFSVNINNSKMKIKVTGLMVFVECCLQANECIVPFDVEQSQGHCQSNDWRESEEHILDKIVVIISCIANTLTGILLLLLFISARLMLLIKVLVFVSLFFSRRNKQKWRFDILRLLVSITSLTCLTITGALANKCIDILVTAESEA